MSLKSKLIQYRDAGYPIAFIESFEEDKVDKIISEIALSNRASVIEWNGAVGACNFETKEPKGTRKLMLDEMLDILLKDDLNRKIIVIKDMNECLSDFQTVALLKQIALKISSGIDCMIIMISPTLIIPKDLEKFITVLEQEYIDENDIKSIIEDFIKENQIQTVAEKLIEKLAIALKGLTEMEINNILSLAVSKNGDITQESLNFIFEQKQQNIKKSGILKMIPLKESIDDIGGLENLKSWLRRKSKVFNNISKAKKMV